MGLTRDAKSDKVGAGPKVALMMTVAGVVIAAVSGAVLHSTWKTAQIHVFVASLYHLPASPWTTGVVASIVFLGIGVLLIVVGLVGVVVRQAVASARRSDG